MKRRSWLQGGLALGLGNLACPVWAQSNPITFVGWSQDEAANKASIAAAFGSFRTAHPEVPLELVGFPYAQMQQNLLLRLRSGQPLDAVQMQERWLPQFARTRRMIDLDTVFGAGSLEKHVDRGLLALGRYDGHQYGLPWTAGSIGMVANTRAAQDAGVKALPATIDEFLDALRRIKKAAPQSVPYGMVTKNNITLSPEFQTWLWTFGGRVFDAKGIVTVDSAAGVRALTFMVDLLAEGLAARDVDRPDARRLFAQHQCMYYFDAPLARSFARDNSGKGLEFDKNIAAMAVPVLRSGDKPQSVAWGHLLSSFQRAPGAAAQTGLRPFVEHLVLDDEVQLRYYRDTGLFPVSRGALSRLASDPYVSTWSNLALSATRDETSLWPASGELTAIIGEETQSALLKQKTPVQALQSMSQRLTTRMAEAPKT